MVFELRAYDGMLELGGKGAFSQAEVDDVGNGMDERVEARFK